MSIYNQSTLGNLPYLTNLTRITTLICSPHIQFMPKLVKAFGGFIDLAPVPAEYSAGIGNMDHGLMSYMVHNYAVQQALDIVGTFRPYLKIGILAGNSTLTSDPSNPAGGTVPKSAVEIANTLASVPSLAHHQ